MHQRYCSWMDAQVQNILNRVCNGFNTLYIIRKTPKLIVFSKNFFGRKIVRQKQEFETLLKQHTSRFEDTIFAINYLCTEQTDVPIAEVDRTINFIQAAFELNNFIKKISIHYENMSAIQQFLLKFYQKPLNTTINELYTTLHSNLRFEADKGIETYIQYLYNIKQLMKAPDISLYTLENITSYFYCNEIIMTYNKATYFNEINNLEESRYIYKFGYGIDFTQNDDKITNILHNNVSTEICRDVIVETRSRDQKIRIHVVQSDYISINDCFDNFPEYEVLVHADSYSSCLYISEQSQQQSLEYTINYGLKSCTIKCFMLE